MERGVGSDGVDTLELVDLTLKRLEFAERVLLLFADSIVELGDFSKSLEFADTEFVTEAGKSEPGANFTAFVMTVVLRGSLASEISPSLFT